MGRGTLGRIMNVIGEPVDYCGPISACRPARPALCPDAPAPDTPRAAPTETNSFLPIHRDAPAFSEQSTELEILVTGIKARARSRPPRRPPPAPACPDGV